MHTGIDIGAPSGRTVVAVRDGIVITVVNNKYRGYGNYVIIAHDNGTSSLYAHNSSLLVSKNQYVKQGQAIARVGSTGASTGPHLHFEIRVNGKHRNPMNYLR
nr:M23 family metallopeptidase [Anaeromonas frigoriresistens]